MRVVGERSVVADNDQFVARRENIYGSITPGNNFKKNIN